MFIAIASLLFGLIMGSFLNVVILRHGARSLGGRSVCFSCGERIAWYDNIPLLSFAALRGRCRHCGSAISLQYPLIEASSAILFGLIGFWASLQFPSAALPFVVGVYFLIAALLLAIFVYDLKHTIIPDAWAYLFAAAALASYGLSAPPEASVLLYLLAGPLSALPLFALWFVSRGAWMGLGDSKLALGIGWLLGPVYGVAAIFFAFVIGAIVSVCILLPLPMYRRLLADWGLARRAAAASFTMKSEVPFGPFLILSALLIWFMLLYHVPLPL